LLSPQCNHFDSVTVHRQYAEFETNQTDSLPRPKVNDMSKGKSLGLSAVFLAIALFVSGSLVLALHQSYAADGQSPNFPNVMHLLQNA
jgi:hypothetical protein